MIKAFRNEYRFLSNFWYVKVNYEELMFPTVEHAFQAAKTEDRLSRIAIRDASSPGKAKRLGSKVQIRPDWDKVKVNIMVKLLRQKFSNPELKEKLLATGNQTLVEGNYWHDNFWGRCGCSECLRGENVLGNLLMIIRAELRN